MNAPFYKFGYFSDEVSFIIAFVTGIGFGFFLERAGFGSARKLAAQFYLRDLTVLKVMFTAIITAMTGVYVLGRLGILDVSLVYLVPTFLVPQIVGGLILGFGFVIGGYCPGTSCVSAATGRVDGMVYVAGMVAGLFGFAEIYPYITGFAHSTPMGQITLPKLFNLPYGLLVFAVVLMALGAFMAAEWAEGKFGGKVADPQGSLTGMPWKFTPVRVLALGLAAIGLAATFAGDPYRGSRSTIDTRDLAIEVSKGADLVQAPELADWIIQDRNDFRLIDLRGSKDFAAYHIPNAENIALPSLDPETAARNEKILLCSEDGLEASKAWFLLRAQGYKSVYVLDGGMRAWQDRVLYPRKTADINPSEFEKQMLVAKYFGGSVQAADANAPAATAVVMPKLPTTAVPAVTEPSSSKAQPKKKKEGC